MNRLKPWFPLPFFALHALLAGVAGWRLAGGALAWAGVLVCALGPLVLMAWFYRRGSSSRHLPWLSGSGLVGVLLAIALPPLDVAAIVCAMLSVDLVLLYIYWYSRLDGGPVQVAEGQPLPAFSLEEQSGKTVSSDSFRGRPALLLFYRGNWCPLCRVQIRQLADQYRRLSEAGVQVLLISPQPHEHTQALAAQYNVPFRFLVDPDNAAAKQLGILAPNSVPHGMAGYAPDAPLPTAIITDADGNVVWLAVTDNYRVRPEPETFMRVIEAL